MSRAKEIHLKSNPFKRKSVWKRNPFGRALPGDSQWENNYNASHDQRKNSYNVSHSTLCDDALHPNHSYFRDQRKNHYNALHPKHSGFLESAEEEL